VGAVKDNIDVAGFATTAGCPAFGYTPARHATAVGRLLEAGLVIIGKTNLDQFATGLVGTRSPYGAPSAVSDARRISGGSSSGSAVVVAHGIVDIALGTDTAGSGRVPAAFNGIVGLKPTHGFVPATGVVPACPSFDCVSVFARTVDLAAKSVALAGGLDDEDPFGREWPPDAPRGLGARPVVALPGPHVLEALDAEGQRAFGRAVERLLSLGMEVRIVDLEPMIDVGARLYGSPLLAQRYYSVGKFIESHFDEVDPVVREIISGGSSFRASELVDEIVRLNAAKRMAMKVFSEVDAVMLPTVAVHPTFGEVAADPTGVNTRLGRFTAFCNLLDCAAIAVPVEPESPALSPTFGVSFFAPAFCDQVVVDLGADFMGEERTTTVTATRGARVVVVGAHLEGQPLNGQLTARGARLVAKTATSPWYRLFALDTVPPKPGLVRVATEVGRSIEVEVWEIPPARYAAFVEDVVPPLALGQIELVDGTMLPGFVLAAHSAPGNAVEITQFGGWRSYLRSREA
jgi:allophanate hydrolase